METKVDFEYERETKRKYRFKELAEEPVLGTLYVSKELFEQRPDRLEVMVRTVD